ncbi:MAG: zinc ribbon domain-containing protein [Thermoplasmatales archaeon]|nr:zinc ribbon domain-containing protein [Thermoplasmatales archaeon]
MKCPACGHDNPEGTLFCEECDWRMDQTPKKLRMGINSVYAAYIAAAVGITSVVSALIDVAWAATVFGIAGTAISGYAQTAVRLSHVKGKLRTTLVAIAGIGIVTSVVGMVYGLTMLF